MGVLTDGYDVGYPQKRFRVAYWVCFLQVTVMFQGGLALLALGQFAVTRNTGGLLPIAFFAPVVAVICAYAAVLVMNQAAPIVGPLGIVCQGFWNTRYFAPWGAVTEVRPHNFCGAVHLRVYATGVPRPLWVPVQLADLPGFADAVREYAGDDHLLTRALDEWLARGAEE